MKKLSPSRMVAWAAALLLCIVLIACGGGGGGGLAPLPDFIPGSVSDTDRDNAVAEVSDYFATVAGNAQAASLMVTKMKSMPVFATAEISASGDVIGWFKDGRQLAVFTSDDLPPASAGHAAQTAAKPPTAMPKNLTFGRRAFLINSFEPAREDSTAALSPLLQQKGYDVTTMSGTLADFTHLSDVSLLLVHAHGLLSTDKHRVQHFYYATSQSPDAITNGVYSADWDNDSLFVGVGPSWNLDGTVSVAKKYCISEQFLINHGLNFVPNAFWMSQSCSSYSTPILNIALGGGSNGVATYAGWTKPEESSESTATTNFVFDRLLGLNQVAPVEQDTPSPYDFDKLRTALSTTKRPGSSLTYDTSIKNDPAKFFIKSANGSTVHTIIPSITAAQIGTDPSTLSIDGFFGAQQGAVTLDGTILTPVSWSETNVVVQKPAADSGVLVVRSLGADSPDGYLLSQPYQYSGLQVEISPDGAALDLSAHQTFTANITHGTLPPGATFKWTLTGNGKINGGTSVTSTSPTVSYVAPNTTTLDSLKVQVIYKGVSQAEKSSTIVVGDVGTIDFTLSGNWDTSKTPPIGHYMYSDGAGARWSPEPGLDALAMSYDIGTEQTIGVLVTAQLTPGQQLVAGQTFTHYHSGDPIVPGIFTLTMSTNLTNPEDPNSSQYAIGTDGTMTIDSVRTLGDSTKYIHFTFTATNGIGGTVTGTGTAKIIPYN
ncbi:MAG: hypothetical protein JST12_15995 [Armatimonadetes bacterium]|nr:hypothetical protein [Armatimonadota bacterium]